MVKLASKPAGEGAATYVVSVRAGDPIYREGEAAGPLYVIEEGQVELAIGGDDDRTRLALLEPGDVFGEISLLEDEPRESEAVAATDCRLLRLDRGALEQVLRSPEGGLALVRRLARRLGEVRRQSAEEKHAGTHPVPVHSEERPTDPVGLPAAPRPGKLVHVSGTEFAVPGAAPVVIGRAAKGHVPDIDLSPVDGDRSLSRKHAVIWREGVQYFVREEPGVANGTFVNRKRLKAGEANPITEGDQVMFGLVKTTFHLV